MTQLYQEETILKFNQEVMPGVRLIRLNSPHLAVSARPGQFVMIACDDGFGRLLRRPISIHQIEGDIVSFLLSVVGKGTEWLAGRQVGENVSWLGPMGNGFNIAPGSHNLLLVAGGIGIAPLMFLAKDALARGCSVKLLAGAKSARYLYPSEFIPSRVEIVTTTEDGSSGKQGLVTTLLPEYIKWADQIFVCGPPPMYQAMAREDYFLNKPVQLSLEIRMGCGLGFCYSCTIKTRQGLQQVCKDGPVFNMQDILWNELQ